MIRNGVCFFSTSRIYNQRGIWVKSVQMLQFLAVGADEICTHQFWFVICFPIDVAAFQELNAERQGLAWGRINESGYLYIRIPGISGRRSRFCSRCVSDLSERGGSKMTLGETGRFSAGAYGEFSYSDRKTLTHPTAGEALNYFTGANANGTRRCRLCFLPSVA